MCTKTTPFYWHCFIVPQRESTTTFIVGSSLSTKTNVCVRLCVVFTYYLMSVCIFQRHPWCVIIVVLLGLARVRAYPLSLLACSAPNINGVAAGNNMNASATTGANNNMQVKMSSGHPVALHNSQQQQQQHMQHMQHHQHHHTQQQQHSHHHQAPLQPSGHHQHPQQMHQQQQRLNGNNNHNNNHNGNNHNNMAHSRMCGAPAAATSAAVCLNGKAPAVLNNHSNSNSIIGNINGPGLLAGSGGQSQQQQQQTKEKPLPMKNSNGGTPVKMHNANNKRMAEPMNGEFSIYSGSGA